MDTDIADEGAGPQLLQALLEKVWGKETVVHLRFDRFEAALGDLHVELDGDLRIKVVVGDPKAPPETARAP